MSMASVDATEQAGEPSTAAVTIIRPRRGWQPVDFAELWRFRDLLWFLSLRDIQLRYKQTVLGVLWAVLQPVAMVLIFGLIFGHLMGMAEKVPEINGHRPPYMVWLFAGLLPWQFFQAVVTQGGVSLVANANLLSKIYFPRLMVPLATAGAPLVDLLVGFTVLALAMALYSVSFQWEMVLLPLLLLSTMMAALGVAILLSALTVSYRDFKHVVPFMIHFWFFLTPVIYPVSLVPPQWAWALYLNPMYGPIEAFRAVILGTQLNATGLAVSSALGVAMMVLGVAYFARVERRFADIA